MKVTSDSELIAAIYDAAFDLEAWNCLPDLLRTRLDANSLVLWYREPDSAFAGSISNLDPAALELYDSRYGAIDPWGAAAQSTGRLGQTLLGSDLVTDHEFRKTEFYADFARHHGTCQLVGAGTRYPTGAVMAFAAHRPFGVSRFDEQHRTLAEMLFPHLARMVRLRMELAALERPRLPETVLARAKVGVAVCSENGEVLYANPAAQRAAEVSGLVLGVGYGRVCASRHGKTVELREGIATAARSGVATAISLEGRRGGRAFVMVSPLDGDATADRRRALVVIRGADDGETRMDLTSLASAFQLTRAEAEVVLLLLSGCSIRDVCAERHVTENTVRTQVSVAMQKIGVANQRELVTLLSQLTSLC